MTCLTDVWRSDFSFSKVEQFPLVPLQYSRSQLSLPFTVIILFYFLPFFFFKSFNPPSFSFFLSPLCFLSVTNSLLHPMNTSTFNIERTRYWECRKEFNMVPIIKKCNMEKLDMEWLFKEGAAFEVGHDEFKSNKNFLSTYYKWNADVTKMN